MKNIIGGVIYEIKKGQVPADVQDPKRYCFCFCDKDWQDTFIMADMWICDKDGNIDPGLNVSPIPVRRDAIGKAVRSLSPDTANYP